MDTLLYLVGFGLLLFFLFGSETLVSIYREKQQMRHIENIIASLPEEERVKFSTKYLKQRVEQLYKTENPYSDLANEE
ncbi:hypothetical protein AN214_04124 [Pseudoalteromonas sp. P1-9]|uniref:hypothetical protein n=1 Tax=Pseudoalteromonas sp. P1-9 TaxID=1710354 RepID=UPI0006D5E11E|nr:hypothetical protein [Pseudoalteromonas sp. P1-9]KPV93828.1 hypothetical protein AN214_04124 [Pseudoalteromonas sp. P1-9]